MERLLFGDNQFFGINHMSEEKARAQLMRFSDLDAIMKVLEAAYDEGLRVFMCTTHDRVAEICDRVRADPSRWDGFQFYPCMPYAHKYANAVTDHGMWGAAMHFMPDDGVLKTALRGGASLARKDIEGVMKILVDAEMKMFAGLPTPVIFLQNVVTDLLMGMGMAQAFRIFHDHVVERYGAEPAYITMNMPMLLDMLESVGIENPIICSNINKIGFRTCGGLDLYEKTLRERKLRAIAMSVYASGAIPPEEALDWVCNLPNLEAIVFGASSRGNIRNTRELVERRWGPSTSASAAAAAAE
ncbi:hypothetical protein P2H44_03590 [Albimonas sp. CAU 1670]|uniref:hypothetical protein n=1 Tax=Albimonas sp. CAU 1670 TaxID=3032599 RepID=UPI0023DA7D84|nr:hypothetical protein [Albimonas sp. CAU 1670]MDF2231628.1 hypothetical protein [Albimonas sp. CAU 1670]